MTATAFNAPLFRSQFPEFQDTVPYPDTLLSRRWTTGAVFVNKNNAGCMYTQDQAQLANDLMAAHLQKSADMLAAGITSAPVVGATEGTVAVQLMPPPASSMFGYWLATTPYGQELRALLAIVASVGMFIGGAPERSAFRRVGGRFG